MKKVKLTPEILTGISFKLKEVEVAQRELQSYIQGCVHGLGLQGNWNVNIEKGVFEEVKKK
ncbi:hypothetical protein CMI37_31820 [Candidatus Pacearchaeota archaeon]|nr:hypothetical protein [Candidatus Pacearchaeota archaeon]|tara:strand:- start:1352 stop:1534 length:183 start_codon:yes stop_codon:yes gene_type:complete